MNERCLELRRSSAARKKNDDEENNADENKKKKKKGKCEFYSSQKVRDFSSHILSEVQDIEGLVGGAKEAVTCPYYSTRAAVPEAEVVMLPYNMILHGDQRKSLNIRCVSCGKYFSHFIMFLGARSSNTFRILFIFLKLGLLNFNNTFYFLY